MYVYAFCSAATALPSLPQGITQPLQTVSAAGITAISEPPLDLETLQQDEARLVSAVVHHDWVLCELVQSLTLLPLRFGTQFRDVDQVRSHLQLQATTYRPRLEALTDQVEISLKLTAKPLMSATSLPVPQGTPLQGRDYFLAKKQRLQQQVLTDAQQHTRLAELRADIIRSYSQHKVEEDRVYLLVHRDAVAQLYEAQRHWQQQFPDCEVQLSGVLPPYHFV